MVRYGAWNDWKNFSVQPPKGRVTYDFHNAIC